MYGIFNKEDLIQRLINVHYDKKQAEELYAYYERSDKLNKLIDYIVFKECTMECI